MSATEIIEQIKGLPPVQCAQVIKFAVENDDSWIPDEFKAMKDAEAGRFVDMETALRETPPPRLRCNIASGPSSDSGQVSTVCLGTGFP